MTKQVLKSSTGKDEFICLTCSLPECVSASPLCPINARNSSTKSETYQAIMEAFAERDRLIQMKKDLENEIRRVRAMKSETDNRQHKRKAVDEIERLKTILNDTIRRRNSLKSKHIAKYYDIPLYIVLKMSKRRFG